MATTDGPKIGDFSQPLIPRPTQSASPTKDALDNAESAVVAESSRDEETLKAKASFEEKLTAAGLTRTRAAEIIDGVLLKGYYAEDIKVTSTVKVRLRTRNARDIKRAQEMLEAQRFSLDSHYAEMWGRLLLAASLENFAGESFVHPNARKDGYDVVEKAFMDRVAYVDALPDPALRVLLQRLGKFDARVSVALEEGTIENF